ncbi:MAG: hypothetical protein PF518_14840 [Spirochaetaceae bacterium]|jgi:hypothetical protein|nr:hypothetical protein [Spirochaetaceae bacterium]
MMQEKTTTDSKNDTEDVRAEELIVCIYKKKIELQEKGIRARQIIMPMEYYNKIKAYHINLGEIQGDYITEDEIFGIPVYIDQIDEIYVK